MLEKKHHDIKLLKRPVKPQIKTGWDTEAEQKLVLTTMDQYKIVMRNGKIQDNGRYSGDLEVNNYLSTEESFKEIQKLTTQTKKAVSVGDNKDKGDAHRFEKTADKTEELLQK